MGLIILILVLWLALGLAGFLLKGLIWLAVIALVGFAITVAWSAVKGVWHRT